ncbi:hypothetical protein [Salimicrobium halophilum]|uniref:ABC-2 family transporter protein n=1 Tax=Salimicrobium halophilum TaxID=86666 RepID=A0A1G8W6U3_9BACI|nr:hypothetical protein [Salimicrobium halophilum]SDJ73843.1 hypothetical protein SAMN04490247_3050 [Salimicrobium halophilum]
MSVFLHELKKLWNPKVLLGVVLISLLFYEFFLSFEIEHFPNGRPALDIKRIYVEMIEDYGNEMNKAEFEDFQKKLQTAKKEAGIYLKNNDMAQELGVTSYEEYRNILNKAESGTDVYEKIDNLHAKIMFDKGVDVFWEIQGFETILSDYKQRGQLNMGGSMHFSVQKRVDKIYKETDFQSILPFQVYNNYVNLIKYTGILIMIVIFIVIGRLYLPDKKKGLLQLQYTTKMGRGLFWSKLSAGMVTTFILTTMYLGLFFLLYSRNETSMFWSSELSSFSLVGQMLSWYDFTFLEYIGVTVAIIYTLAFCTAAISAMISSIVPNYMTLVGFQIPVAILLALLISSFLLVHVFSIMNALWVYWLIFIGLVAGSGGILFFRSRREKRADIT